MIHRRNQMAYRGDAHERAPTRLQPLEGEGEGERHSQTKKKKQETGPHTRQ